MSIGNLFASLGLLTASTLLAQGPLFDKVEVNLQYPVTVNNTTLQPGDYVIRQLDNADGGNRVLRFYSDQGLKLETTVIAIPTLDNRTPSETKLVLNHVGNDYYLNKMWVQGKSYGYEFELPSEIRMREQERNAPATVVAQYKAPATQTTEQVAETRTEPAPAPAPAQAQPETTAPVEVAQNRPPAPAPAPAPQAAEPAPAMPHTAANWLNMLLGGGLLAGSGFALLRFRA